MTEIVFTLTTVAFFCLLGYTIEQLAETYYCLLTLLFAPLMVLRTRSLLRVISMFLTLLRSKVLISLTLAVLVLVLPVLVRS